MSRPAIATAQVRSQTKSSGGGEWLIGIGTIPIGNCRPWRARLFTPININIMGLFGLFGPDLTKTAQTSDFTIHYGSDWNGKS